MGDSRHWRCPTVQAKFQSDHRIAAEGPFMRA